MATKQGDYQYDFVDPLPEECPCLVCLEVQVDPHQVTCCGKIFCKSCLDQLVRKNQNCPNCRKQFSRDECFRDLNTERKINQLRVHCEYNKKGCEWIGRLKDMKELHFPECLYSLVPCTNIKDKKKRPMKRCGVLLQRQELHKHMTELCEWKQMECTHCKSADTHHFITGVHIAACPDVLVSCSNEGCDIKVKRKLLPEHKTSCLKQVVSCRYCCTANVTRDKMDSHCLKCMGDYLDKVVTEHRQTVVKLNTTRAQLDTTCDKLRTTVERVAMLETKTSHHGKIVRIIKIVVYAIVGFIGFCVLCAIVAEKP